MAGQVLFLAELVTALRGQRDSKKVVFTNGCFDLLHVGHIRYLAEAKSQGDLLIVGLNSDKSVKGLKGPERPIQHEQDRAEVLAALEAVDYVVLFDEETPLHLIEILKPDVLVKGGDWPVEKIVGFQQVTAYGGEVKTLSFVPGRSSTAILEKIKSL